MPAPIRVAVVGGGAFGRNHLRVLHDLSHSTPTNLTPEHQPRSHSGPGNSTHKTQQDPASNLITSSLTPEQQPLSHSGPGNSTLKTQQDSPSNLITSSLTPEQQLRSHSGPDNSELKTEQDAHPEIQLAAIVDSDSATRTEAAARYNIPAFASVAELLAAGLGLHAATVCVPTRSHAAIAGELLEAGLDVLVEKPLTATLAEADALIALAASRGRILAAGHLERFNPAVTAALGRLTRPMFFEAHRLSIFTPRSLDVDVVLDLMIHDLDILLTMANSPVREVRAVGLPVLSHNVDIANVRLEFQSGAVANLTASRVSTEQVRKLRLFQPAQYLSLDYARQELLTINVDAAAVPAPSTGAARPPMAKVSDGLPASPSAHPSTGLSFTKLDLPRAEPLRLELGNFLEAVATRNPPRVAAAAARNALALALDINDSMAQHAARAGL